jgi:hypothetical protein
MINNQILNYKYYFPLIIFFLFVGDVKANSFKKIDKSSVYIECFNNSNLVSQGSGVVITKSGHVLTSKHVHTPKDSNLGDSQIRCYGSTAGNFDVAGGRRLLRLVKKSSSYDAALLKFPSYSDENYLDTYCSINSSIKRQAIYATGYPKDKQNDTPSSRRGVISTTELTSGSQLMTVDSFTNRGMSGGMVTFNESDVLVGIIAGAGYDKGTGTVNKYAVLPIEAFIADFGNILNVKDCSPKLIDSNFEWNTTIPGDGEEIKTGVSSIDGFCFITRVFGEFNSAKDSIEVYLDRSGEYVITGYNESGGNHGVKVQCINK